MIAGAMGQGAMIVSMLSGLKEPQGYATGGLIRGAGTGTSDSIPIMASDEEFMIRAASVKSIGTEDLDYINKYGELPQNTYRVGMGTVDAINRGADVQAERQAQALGAQQAQQFTIINQIDRDDLMGGYVGMEVGLINHSLHAEIWVLLMLVA